MTNKDIADRIAELTDKIPPGTVCDDTNCCGGFLTQQEEDELNELFRLQARLAGATCDLCGAPATGIGPTMKKVDEGTPGAIRFTFATLRSTYWLHLPEACLCGPCYDESKLPF